MRGEKDVVLKCGCITTSYGSIHCLGDNYDEQICPHHGQWTRVIREAISNDKFRWYVQRIPATARATNKSYRELQEVPGSNQKPKVAKRLRNEDPTLF